MRAIPFVFLLMLFGAAQTAHSQGSESGLLGVYPDYLHGRTTASGVPYDMGQLSGAHASLPLGSFARIANFDTGRMVDVKITDRKPKDNMIVTLSKAAAERIGVPTNGSAPGSLLLISGIKTPAQPAVVPNTRGMSAPSPALPAGAGAIGAVAATSIQNAKPQPRGFKPFSLFKKKDPLYDAVVNKSAAIDPVARGRAAANQRVTNAQAQVNQKSGGLFKNGLFGSRAPKSAQATTYAPAGRAGYTYPELKPVSASNGIPSPDVAAVPVPAPVPVVQSPVYRVQFGAFRNHKNAVEMAQGLGSSGIATSVIPIQGRNLNAVLLNGAFRSHTDAQNWINTEAARRGWREKPVVVR